MEESSANRVSTCEGQVWPSLFVVSTTQRQTTLISAADANREDSPEITPQEAAQLQTSVFEVLGREDRGTWNAIVAADCRAFERGEEFDKNGFFFMILAAHRAGRQIKWSVQEPRVEISVKLLLISYINVGSIRIGIGEPKKVHWLETAGYRWAENRWQLFHVTSMRAANTDDV